MTKREQKQKHLNDLSAIFHMDVTTELYSTLQSTENRLHKLAESYCNGTIEEEPYTKRSKNLLQIVDSLLHFTTNDIPVFVNQDPRGYSLKIEDDFIRKLWDSRQINFYRDFGGYGIICPDF